MELNYRFEPMVNGMWQVRLCGEFVCYSTHTNPDHIDRYLRNEGYENRKAYLDACLKECKKNM